MATTAIITGSSQGIGRATAFLLAQKGYNVVLAAPLFEAKGRSAGWLWRARDNYPSLSPKLECVVNAAVN